MANGWTKQNEYWLHHKDGHTISKGMSNGQPIYLLWSEDKKIIGRFQSAKEAMKKHHETTN